MQNIHLFELNFIRYIQELRCPFFDFLFKALNIVDTPIFSLILIPILWMGVNWKWGARLLYIIIINAFLNDFFKHLFMQPRPFDIDPSLGIITVGGYGFPSGGAQTAVLYAAILFSCIKNKKWAWTIALNVVFWISLSRLYLGVHFITDILGGYLVGAFIVFIFFYVFPYVEKEVKKMKLSQAFIYNLVFAFFMFFAVRRGWVMHLAISVVAISVGLVLSAKFNMFLKPSKTFLEGLLRSVLALLGMGIILLLIYDHKGILPIIILGYLLLGLWLGFFASLIWKKTFYKLKMFR